MHAVFEQFRQLEKKKKKKNAPKNVEQRVSVRPENNDAPILGTTTLKKKKRLLPCPFLMKKMLQNKNRPAKNEE